MTRTRTSRAKSADAGSPKTKASGTGADKYACDDETIARARELADHVGAESATVGGWSQSAGRETKAQIGFSLNASREEAGGVHRVCEVSMLRTPQSGRGAPAAPRHRDKREGARRAPAGTAVPCRATPRAL